MFFKGNKSDENRTQPCAAPAVLGMSGIVCRPMPERRKTWRVVLQTALDYTVGWVRFDAVTRKWVARSPGDEAGKRAAQIRRFDYQNEAVTWLLDREPAGRSERPKKRSLPLPAAWDKRPIDNTMCNHMDMTSDEVVKELRGENVL